MTKVLVVTYWNEVRKLQEEIQGGNPKILVQFLEFLIKSGINFRGQFLTDMCESSFKEEVEIAWSLLHYFSHDYYKSDKPKEE